MTLENICTSKDTSQRLAEAGFPQKGGLFYWCKPSGKLCLEEKVGDRRYYYRAFTFNELWKLLPKEIVSGGICVFKKKLYMTGLFDRDCTIEYHRNYNKTFLEYRTDRKLQEAAAELALWCVEKGYLTLVYE